ncbi:hypothetical protein DYB32_000337 [Aphanomyces invadans]|uniref:Uncharacterized protein n=1 Tax=Aphanomyces invadans TaxID=157072 RepID=A0A3R6WU40_9STRA|nr:hypothetical protein DYB32_000337 [Aphanomyces invadans]
MQLITTKDDRKHAVPLSVAADATKVQLDRKRSNQFDVDALTSIEDANDSKEPTPTARVGYMHSLDDLFTNDMAYHEEKIRLAQSNLHDASATGRVQPSYAFDEAWTSCAALKKLFDTTLPMYDDQVIALAQAAAENLPFQNVHLGTVLREIADVLSTHQPRRSQGRHLDDESADMKHIRHFLSHNK